MSRWKRPSDGSILKHPDGHHGHTTTGQPVYHEPNACVGDKYGGYSWVYQGTTLRTFGEHGDHHRGLDHTHEGKEDMSTQPWLGQNESETEPEPVEVEDTQPSPEGEVEIEDVASPGRGRPKGQGTTVTTEEVAAIVGQADHPLSLEELVMAVYGEDNPTLRNRMSFHVRNGRFQGLLIRIGKHGKYRYKAGQETGKVPNPVGRQSKGTKTRQTKAPKVTPVNLALNVGDLFEFIGLTGDGGQVVRQLESQRIYKISAL